MERFKKFVFFRKILVRFNYIFFLIGFLDWGLINYGLYLVSLWVLKKILSSWEKIKIFYVMKFYEI